MVHEKTGRVVIGEATDENGLRSVRVRADGEPATSVNDHEGDLRKLAAETAKTNIKSADK